MALKEPSIRPLAKAYEMKLAKSTIFDWRTMIDAHTADRLLLLVSDYLRTKIRTESERIAGWIKEVKSLDANAPASKATWHRYIEQLDDTMRSGQRPNRITLTQTAPALEYRPRDGLITKNEVTAEGAVIHDTEFTEDEE